MRITRSTQKKTSSYAKISLGIEAIEGPGIAKVLDVQWNVELLFDIGDVIQSMVNLEPTKGIL